MLVSNILACSPSYNCDKYEKFRSINSQINEQQNSSTKNLAKQLSYMTEENFKKHCSFFMWQKNEEKRQVMHAKQN